MNPLVNMSYSDQLKHNLLQHQGIMQILHALYAIDTQAYLAAGVVRNLIWSQRHQQHYALEGTEVDVIYYAEHDDGTQGQRIQQQMQLDFPHIHWDVTNQATVHQWYRLENGEPIQALKSIEHALSLWPETATAIAVKLDDQQQIQLIAPLGLDDLFELNVRWNPRLVSQATFLQRVQQKQFLQRWPKLKLLMTPEA